MSSPSGVRGGSPAASAFSAYVKPTEQPIESSIFRKRPLNRSIRRMATGLYFYSLEQGAWPPLATGLCVCPCCKWKMAWAINTELGRHTVHGIALTPRSKGHREVEVRWLSVVLRLLRLSGCHCHVTSTKVAVWLFATFDEKLCSCKQIMRC